MGAEAEGLWVIKHWAPWLDPLHPRPARPGELRWFTTGPDGEDIEVDGRGRISWRRRGMGAVAELSARAPVRQSPRSLESLTCKRA
jgi:hypothetical protein